MAKISNKNRFTKSHILRISVSFLALFSTVFFPLVFAYPKASAEMKYVIIVIVIFSALSELIICILVSHFFVYSKISKLAIRLSNISEAAGKKKFPYIYSIDNSVTNIINAAEIASDEYAKLEQTKKAFISNASHELRSPLTSIQGFLQAILDGTADKKDSEKYLTVALNETKRLNSMINSMLDLSRLDSGKNPLLLSKFDINDTIREVAAKFEPALIKKTLQINVDFAREKCYVYADKDKIIQVLINLIDNAIKYSPAYSRIILTTGIHDDKVYVTVRDFGYGISKKDQMLIWDTFYMTDRSRSPIKTKGSGLGLSIVKKIISEHGEVIWVESSRGAGATFIFTLTLYEPNTHKLQKDLIISYTDDEKNPLSVGTIKTVSLKDDKESRNNDLPR